jgi:hypothetical protein
MINPDVRASIQEFKIRPSKFDVFLIEVEVRAKSGNKYLNRISEYILSAKD